MIDREPSKRSTIEAALCAAIRSRNSAQRSGTWKSYCTERR